MIYVVTAVHNRKTITQQFVEALLAQTSPEKIHLLIVDDGSTDGTDLMVKSKYPNSTILYGKGNLFWGGAMQLAYRYLVSINVKNDDVVFYINDDSKLEPDYITNMVKNLKRHPDDLVTGCGYGVDTGKYLDGPIHFNLNNGAVHLLPPESVGNCASTRALGMMGKVFKDIGGFHPILLPHYGSDYEYTIRAYKKGHKIITDNSLKYTFTEYTTGNNSRDNLSLKKIFSKRSKLNPIYKFNFIILIAPFYRLPGYIKYQLDHFGDRK